MKKLKSGCGRKEGRNLELGTDSGRCLFVWFNWQMILVFREYGSMPETYACAVVAATIGECGICGWIRTNKDKRLDRKWQKEDEKESQEQYVPDINVGNKNEEENL